MVHWSDGLYYYALLTCEFKRQRRINVPAQHQQELETMTAKAASNDVVCVRSVTHLALVDHTPLVRNECTNLAQEKESGARRKGLYTKGHLDKLERWFRFEVGCYYLHIDERFQEPAFKQLPINLSPSRRSTACQITQSVEGVGPGLVNRRQFVIVFPTENIAFELTLVERHAFTLQEWKTANSYFWAIER
jgi:hypothetical protein